MFRLDDAVTTRSAATPERIVPSVIDRLLRELADVPRSARRATADGFWADLRRVGTPLVDRSDRPDQRDVTFVWRGTPDSQHVRMSMHGLPRDRPAAGRLEPIEDTDLWYAGFRLRADHRSSYSFDTSAEQHSGSVGRQQEPTGRHDPLNPIRLPGRWGRPDGSIFALPDAPPDPWLLPQNRADRPTGSVARHRVQSDRLGCERDVWIYRPPAAEQVGHSARRALPLLVLCDGDRWFGELDLAAVLDTMINTGVLPPLQVLSPDAVDLDTRWRELSAHQPFVSFLADELLPWAAARWPLPRDPARTVIAGQSLGGLTALYAALSRPDRFGSVLAQSASLWWRPGLPIGRPYLQHQDSCWLAERFAAADRLPSSVQLQVGLHEATMPRQAGELADALRYRGVSVTCTAFNGGHDYACWRSGLLTGLKDLFPR